MTCCFFSVVSCCFFPVLLFTTNRKEDISNIIFLSDSETSLHPLQFLEVCWSVSKTPRSNGIQMSEKFRKLPLSKNEDTKAERHFQENKYHGYDTHANRNKIDWPVQHLWSFEIHPACSHFIFYWLPSPNVFDFGRKI